METSLKLQPEGHDLVRALGSKYFRNASTEDDETPGDRPEGLPTSLTQAKILKIYRDQLLYWGTANLGTWGDEVNGERFEYAMKWLTELVVGAFPEMKEYLR